jgi:hypothetical protein
MFVSCVYIVLSCEGRDLCDGLALRICICEHRNLERSPMFQLGTYREMNDA